MQRMSTEEFKHDAEEESKMMLHTEKQKNEEEEEDDDEDDDEEREASDSSKNKSSNNGKRAAGSLVRTFMPQAPILPLSSCKGDLLLAKMREIVEGGEPVEGAAESQRQATGAADEAKSSTDSVEHSKQPEQENNNKPQTARRRASRLCCHQHAHHHHQHHQHHRRRSSAAVELKSANNEAGAEPQDRKSQSTESTDRLGQQQPHQRHAPRCHNHRHHPHSHPHHHHHHPQHHHVKRNSTLTQSDDPATSQSQQRHQTESKSSSNQSVSLAKDSTHSCSMADNPSHSPKQQPANKSNETLDEAKAMPESAHRHHHPHHHHHHHHHHQHHAQQNDGHHHHHHHRCHHRHKKRLVSSEANKENRESSNRSLDRATQDTTRSSSGGHLEATESAQPDHQPSGHHHHHHHHAHHSHQHHEPHHHHHHHHHHHRHSQHHLATANGDSPSRSEQPVGGQHQHHRRHCHNGHHQHNNKQRNQRTRQKSTIKIDVEPSKESGASHGSRMSLDGADAAGSVPTAPLIVEMETEGDKLGAQGLRMNSSELIEQSTASDSNLITTIEIEAPLQTAHETSQKSASSNLDSCQPVAPELRVLSSQNERPQTESQKRRSSSVVKLAVEQQAANASDLKQPDRVEKSTGANQKASARTQMIDVTSGVPNLDRRCRLCWCCCFPCSAISGRTAAPTRAEARKLANKSNEQLSNSVANNLCAQNVSLEEIRAWSESFDRLMKCPEGRKLFQEFLRCEYSEENILFWTACEDLRAEKDTKNIANKARDIYEDYISILSSKEVSLDSRVRDVINQNIKRPTSHIFDEAQLQIYTLMHRDSYPRFINSPMYKKLAQIQQTSSSRKSSSAMAAAN